VSPDGTRVAFQLSIDGDVEGEGRGLLLFDLAASGRAPARPLGIRPSPESLVGPVCPPARRLGSR
jgi:hypothetical protein